MSSRGEQLELLTAIRADHEAVPLPEGWRWAKVQELAAPEPRSLTDGPFGSNLKSSHYTDAGPQVIRLQNIGDGVFLDSEAHISPEHFETLRKHEARAGDVVVAMLGEDLPRACVVPARLGAAIVKADCVRFRVARPFNPGCIAAFLNAPQSRGATRKLIHGVGRPRLGLKLFRQLELPVPPSAETDRLETALDGHLSRLDAAVSGLERAQANLKRYRASVLKSAVEGRLVPTEAELAREEGRDYEPASVLLERILVERRRRWEEAELAKMEAKGKPPKNDKWKAKYKEPAGPDVDELPELPEGWCWATVEQLASHEPRSLTDGPFGSNLKTSHYTDAGPRVVRLQNIGDGEFLDSEAHISEDHYERLIKHAVFENDLVIASLGASLPRAALVPASFGKGIVKADCIRLSVESRLVSPEFAMNVLNAWSTRKRTEVLVHGVGRPRIGLTLLRTLAVPLPPRGEQDRIVEELSRQYSVADGIMPIVGSNLGRAGRLRQAILKWAFEGKLVDQDPDDEPASVLLDRIRAEREAAAPPKKKLKPRKKKTKK